MQVSPLLKVALVSNAATHCAIRLFILQLTLQTSITAGEVRMPKRAD